MPDQVDSVNHQGEADVLESMHGLMHLYRAHRLRALRESGEGLALMEARALGFFARNPGASQSELVAHSGRDKAQVARLIAALKARGLVEAHADDQDRRSSRLQLTAQGRALHQRLHRQARRLSALATADLAQEERAALLALLARMQRNLQQAG